MLRKKSENGPLKLSTDKSDVNTYVFGSTSLNTTITDQFYSPAIDIKKKYKRIPNQYHIAYNTLKKSKKMRYLTIIQMEDTYDKIPDLKITNDSVYTFGDIRLKAELHTNKEPSLTIFSKKDAFYLNSYQKDKFKGNPVLIEENGSKKNVLSSEKLTPEF